MGEKNFFHGGSRKGKRKKKKNQGKTNRQGHTAVFAEESPTPKTGGGERKNLGMKIRLFVIYSRQVHVSCDAYLFSMALAVAIRSPWKFFFREAAPQPQKKKFKVIAPTQSVMLIKAKTCADEGGRRDWQKERKKKTKTHLRHGGELGGVVLAILKSHCLLQERSDKLQGLG